MQDIDNDYIEIATNYMNAGLYGDGIEILTGIKNPRNPLVKFYMAWFYAHNNDMTEAKKCIEEAGKISIDYCFPYRQESETVLNFVRENDPQNAQVQYLLGNLLYDLIGQ